MSFALPSFAVEPVEPVDCILDSDCPRGHCIDLLCVDGPSAPTGSEPPTKGPAEPEEEPKRSQSAPSPDQNTPEPNSVREPRPPRRRRPRPKRGALHRSPPPPSNARPVENLDTAPSPPPISDEPVAHRKRDERIWYGSYLLATYAAPPLALAIAVDQEEFAPVALSLFAAPIVHWVNKQVGKGFLALFMQPVFAGAGALVASGACDRDCDTPVLLGALAGYGGWVAIDVAVQGYKPAPKEQTVVVRTRGLGLEVGGAF